MKLTAAQAYLQSLQTHIKYVQEAGDRLGVPRRVLNSHDESKFSRQEFMPYANYFFNEDGTPRTTGRSVPVEELSGTEIDIQYQFTLAWKHHLQHNDHHWQHWMFPDGYHTRMMVDTGIMTEGGVMKMDGVAALHMIADWEGASMAYTGSWNMSAWLDSNIPRITLHPDTAEYVRIKLIEVDGRYRRIVDNTSFKHEL